MHSSTPMIDRIEHWLNALGLLLEANHIVLTQGDYRLLQKDIAALSGCHCRIVKFKGIRVTVGRRTVINTKRAGTCTTT